MNRRIDPEQLGAVCWPQIWRSLRVSRRCKPVQNGYWMRSKDEWDVDTGYCLDRYSTLAEMTSEDNRRAAG